MMEVFEDGKTQGKIPKKRTFHEKKLKEIERKTTCQLIFQKPKHYKHIYGI